MDISQLRNFNYVAYFSSFSRASEALHVTQSAMSRSIQRLEKELGFLLFERKRGGRVILTWEGKYFHEHVNRILNELDQTVLEIRNSSDLTRGIVNLCVDSTIHIDSVIRDFLFRNPEVQFSFSYGNTEDIQHGLSSGNFQLAVMRGPIVGEHINWHPVFEDRLTVLLSKSHPLANEKSISLSQLDGEHFFVHSEGGKSENMTLPACLRAGFRPHIVFEGLGGEVTCQLIGRGFGVTLVPHSINLSLFRSPTASNASLSIIPLSDSFAVSTIALATSSQYFLSAASLILFREIESYFRRLPPCVI